MFSKNSRCLIKSLSGRLREATAGNVQAQVEIGRQLLYAWRTGDVNEAIEWLLQAANKGDQNAQQYLTEVPKYLIGKITPKSFLEYVQNKGGLEEFKASVSANRERENGFRY